MQAETRTSSMAVFFLISTLTVFLSHLVITDGLHRLAHTNLWPWFKDFHLRGHHEVYRVNFISRGYRQPPGIYNAPVLFFLAMAAISPVLLTFYLLAFPPVVLAWSLIAFLTFGWFHTWTHEEFHNSATKLKQFRWYRHLVKLHMVHHAMDEYMTDGARIVNLGGYNFWLDRLYGTFEPRLPRDYKSRRAATGAGTTSLPSG